MKRLLALIGLLIALGAPQVATALEIGKCVRDGPTIVCNMGCRAFSMDSFDAMWPQGVSTFGYLGMAVIGSQRDLTPEELELCTGVVAPIQLWKVAVNGAYPDRPAKLISADADGNVILIAAPKTIRYAIGEPCDNSIPTFTKTSSGGKEWRYFAGQKVYVVLCEYK